MTSLHETSIEVLTLAKIGYELYHAALNGACLTHGAIENNATRRWQRMDSPITGDLVIEMSTSGWWLKGDQPHPGPHAYLKVENAIGHLDKITQEPYPREKDEPVWDEVAEGRPEPLERCYYIKLLHEEMILRWTNARFVTILPVEGWPL